MNAPKLGLHRYGVGGRKAAIRNGGFGHKEPIKAGSRAAADRLTPANEGVGFEAFKSIVGYGEWAEIEDRFGR